MSRVSSRGLLTAVFAVLMCAVSVIRAENAPAGLQVDKEIPEYKAVEGVSGSI